MSALIPQIQHFEYLKNLYQADIDEHDKQRNTLIRENKTDDNDKMIAYWDVQLQRSNEQMRNANKCFAQALAMVLKDILQNV